MDSVVKDFIPGAVVGVVTLSTVTTLAMADGSGPLKKVDRICNGISLADRLSTITTKLTPAVKSVCVKYAARKSEK